MTALSVLAASWAALTGLALAHGGLNNYTVGDTWYRGYDPNSPREEQEGQPWMVQRLWASIDPIFSATSPKLACNDPGTAPPSYMPIRAGEDITALYWYWLHPVGPMSAWLAPCLKDPDDYSNSGPADCRDIDPARAGWFKVWEAGLLDGDLVSGTWYQKGFQRWDGRPAEWPVTIPASIRPGLYMIRHEILSIHIADKPQFYPECAHLNISGAGDALPPKEFWFKFPGAYKDDDPSIKIDIYSNKNKETTNYTIPGGRVWEGFDFVVDKYCLGC